MSKYIPRIEKSNNVAWRYESNTTKKATTVKEWASESVKISVDVGEGDYRDAITGIEALFRKHTPVEDSIYVAATKLETKLEEIKDKTDDLAKKRREGMSETNDQITSLTQQIAELNNGIRSDIKNIQDGCKAYAEKTQALYASNYGGADETPEQARERRMESQAKGCKSVRDTMLYAGFGTLVAAGAFAGVLEGVSYGAGKLGASASSTMTPLQNMNSWIGGHFTNQAGGLAGTYIGIAALLVLAIVGAASLSASGKEFMDEREIKAMEKNQKEAEVTNKVAGEILSSLPGYKPPTQVGAPPEAKHRAGEVEMVAPPPGPPEDPNAIQAEPPPGLQHQ